MLGLAVDRGEILDDGDTGHKRCADWSDSIASSIGFTSFSALVVGGL
jgi:hypothetical protein